MDHQEYGGNINWYNHLLSHLLLSSLVENVVHTVSARDPLLKALYCPATKVFEFRTNVKSLAYIVVGMISSEKKRQ